MSARKQGGRQPASPSTAAIRWEEKLVNEIRILAHGVLSYSRRAGRPTASNSPVYRLEEGAAIAAHLLPGLPEMTETAQLLLVEGASGQLHVDGMLDRTVVELLEALSVYRDGAPRKA